MRQYFSSIFNSLFSKFVLLDPKGIIALKERNVMFAAVSLMLILVIPTFIFTIVIGRKYSAKNPRWQNENKNQRQNQTSQDGMGRPNANDSQQGAGGKTRLENVNTEKKSSRLVMIMWWVLPAIIIFFLATIDIVATHELDPYQPIASDVPPITVQVVAMQWKWLFIYPAQGIATVNFLEIPVNTPIHFVLTSDNAPMNSFWVPQLSGQIYTMTGMSTQLNFMATAPGDFAGRGAEMSGQGFAGMAFTVRSVSSNTFDQWVTSTQQSLNTLDDATYQALLAPSQNVPAMSYSNVAPDLYDTIVMKYMATSTDMGDMNMQ